MTKDSSDVFANILEWARGLPVDQQEWLKRLTDREIAQEHMFLGLQIRNMFLRGQTNEQRREIQTILIGGGSIKSDHHRVHPDVLSGPLIKWIRGQI